MRQSSLTRLGLTLLLSVLVTLLLSACASGTAPRTADPTAPASLASFDARPWSFETSQGTVTITPSYRIHTTEEAPYIVDRLPAFMEASLDRYCSVITALPKPARPMDIFLFANRGEWKRYTERFLGQHAELYVQIPRGGYSSRGKAVLWQIGPHDTFAIAAHEGWHQYTQQPDFRDRLPIWIEEGMATFMEGYRFKGRTPVFLPWTNLERFGQLRRAVNANAIIPLDDLITSSPQEQFQNAAGDELTYYAQVWALVHFLLEGEGGVYRPGLERLLRDAASGGVRQRLYDTMGSRSQAELLRDGLDRVVFKAYFSDDLTEVGQEYEQFLRHIVRRGAKDRIVRGESPVHER